MKQLIHLKCLHQYNSTQLTQQTNDGAYQCPKANVFGAHWVIINIKLDCFCNVITKIFANWYLKEWPSWKLYLCCRAQVNCVQIVFKRPIIWFSWFCHCKSYLHQVLGEKVQWTTSGWALSGTWGLGESFFIRLIPVNTYIYQYKHFVRKMMQTLPAKLAYRSLLGHG